MTVIEIKRGNPLAIPIKIRVKNSSEPFSLVGKTILFTAKRPDDFSTNDDLAIIKKTITTHANAEGGESFIELSGADTDVRIGKYRWDIKIVGHHVNLNSGTGILNIVRKVTMRVT